eukprot:snap_masked-scaffold_10-processed-gene-3.32-mRNA-1 protein AED:1.00 eAED:1.00 QI:0/0/0/0/1/1/2/0/71
MKVNSISIAGRENLVFVEFPKIYQYVPLHIVLTENSGVFTDIPLNVKSYMMPCDINGKKICWKATVNYRYI